MQVELPKEYSDELYTNMKNLLLKAVEDTQRQTAINSPWLKGKRATAKYLNVSIQTLNKMIIAGLPYHTIDSVDGVAFFAKKEINKFLMEH